MPGLTAATGIGTVANGTGMLGVTLLIFAGALVVLGALALVLSQTLGHRWMLNRRMARFGGETDPSRLTVPNIRRQREGEKSGPLQRILAFTPFGAEVKAQLRAAGSPMSRGTFATMSAVLAAVGYLGTTVARLDGPVVLLSALVAGLVLPRLGLAFLVARRKHKFLVLFPDTIDLMIRSLRSGFPVDEAITAVGDEMPDPIGLEFKGVADRLRLGQTLESALFEAAERIDLPDFNFFTISLAVQRETGGNLTETLANLADILRRRLQMRLKVKAMSAEARTSAMIIGALPFVLAGALFASNPEYVLSLFQDPRGRLIVFIALASESLGIFTMIRMARFRI
ncbi:MAG: type II secretion system F family protein [Rhodospirillaceae bacterium]|nr:type II secretion system F family protein [Rhodospirillaceae bacterium]MBT6138764.1 type II secretion system F family protein [Rhodospirillaceae bacterium]